MMARVAEGAGEPFQRGWTRGDVEALVVRCGLQVAEHPTADVLFRRYFANRTDGLRPANAERLIAAKVA
jgi:hypothetical protein